MTENFDRLIGAIYIQAVKDWSKDQNRSEIQRFFHSRWGNTIAEALDMSPGILLGKMQAGDYRPEEIRAAYR